MIRDEGGVSTKTRTHEDSLILDRVVRRVETRLIPVGQSKLAAEVENVFEELGCEKLEIVVDGLRQNNVGASNMSSREEDGGALQVFFDPKSRHRCRAHCILSKSLG